MVCDLARSCSPDLDVSIGRCYCATALASLTEIERRHLDAGPCAKRMRFSNVPNTPANQLRRLRQGKGVAHRITFYVISYVKEGTYLLSCRSSQNRRTPPMTTRAQEYRYLAERVRHRAQTDARFAAEWEQLARCYLLLAGEAEGEEQVDIFDDPILPKPH